MNFSADTATTHVGWRQAGSDAADADHLLIRHDWGDPPNPSGDPVLRFLAEEETAGTSAAGTAAAGTAAVGTAAAGTIANSAAQAIPAAEVVDNVLNAKLNDVLGSELDPNVNGAHVSDADVNDAAVDAPPYLWGGEALFPDSVSSPNETVFS